MTDSIYEIVAQGARYWFLFLMALIAWRSWRWYRKDKKKAKKRLKLLPDAGFVGEMVVTVGDERLPQGTVLSVPREGTLGMLRTNDLCVPFAGVDRRHLWFRFDDDQGLMVKPFGKNAIEVDGEAEGPLHMAHGSRLRVGEGELRLRLFAGFESVGHARRQGGVEDAPEQQPQAAPYDPMQMMAMQQQWMMQQQMLAMQQAAYQQGYQQAMQQMDETEDEDEDDETLYDEEIEALPFDMAQIAQEEGMIDHSMFMRPDSVKKPEPPQYDAPAPSEPAFYAPEEDADDDAWEEEPSAPYDEDMTDAAAPPKSAYVGHDEAEAAKKHLWDKYFGGGPRR